MALGGATPGGSGNLHGGLVVPWIMRPYRRGSVKGDSRFPGSRNWMVVVPSTETAKTREGAFGGEVGHACFFRFGFEIPLSRANFMCARLVWLLSDPHWL